MTLTKAMKIKVIEWWFETKSIVTIKRRLQNVFRLAPHQLPSRSTARYIVNKFIGSGELTNPRATRTGRPQTARHGRNVQIVEESVKDNPKQSCERRSQELSIPRSSLHRILTKDLSLTPYIVPVKQALSAPDTVARKEMCGWFMSMLEEDRRWIDQVWFSDESHF